MSERNAQPASGPRAVKVAFGVVAIACLLAGLGLYLFADRIGMSEDTANIVAIAFIAAGVGDYLVLKFWDRIASRR